MTKEELGKMCRDILIHKNAFLCEHCVDILRIIQVEFGHYIDVLEPLVELQDWKDLRDFVSMGKEFKIGYGLSPRLVAITETVKRACDLIDKKSDPWIKCPTCHGTGKYKNITYCTQCGKEIER